ncbi:MAG TPA: Ig-like domain-containing protein, partial [Anaerolineaceae bacterium]|nr:Ig-like domain-containing protein [Anaerolineaceae bacterium]
TYEKAFTITVTNVNEAPTDISLSNSSVAENSAVNTIVGTFLSTDPDAGNTFTYSLVSGTGADDNSSFTISENSLRTSAAFDYETKNSYSVRVRTTDQGGLYYEEAFTITVTNVNEAPTDIGLTNSSVEENSAINTVVGALSSTDPDVGDSFTYTIVSGDTAAFNISDSNLRTSAVFDYETKASYSITIRTTDAGGLYYEEAFTITVTDVYEEPGLTKIAVISDFGVNISDTHKANIAALVTNWDPDAVVTGGDNYHDRTPLCNSYAECLAGYNNYTAGYTDFVTPQTFFPSYGNHDAMHSSAYTSYFSYLPSSPDASHLYYDVKVGNIHFWVLNGNVTIPGSAQQTWLAANAPDTTAAWNIVVVHQAPYSTGYYGDLTATQLPYQNYGIDFVISGHNHSYERLLKDGIRYFIAGRAGQTEERACDGTGSAATSEFCASIQNPANNSYGYMQIVASETSINFKFITEAGATLDTFTKTKETPVEPTITTSVSSLPAFSSRPGVPSSVASYTVQAANLTQNLVITAPPDFEISTSNDSGFGSTITLAYGTGTISPTTIYVRFNRSTEGTSSGNITHVSSPATSKQVSVSGTATEPQPWTAYNDMSGTSTPDNTTEFTLGQVDGMLKDFDTGVDTGVTVTVTSEGDPYNYTSGGTMPDAGTDAYINFNGKVDLVGVIMSNTSNPVDYWVDVTFEGLDPAKTYTFVATANRNGTGDPSSGQPYDQRETRYTISGIDSAINASSSGVVEIDEYSVHFVTGNNTSAGYVAKWVAIQPGSDGSFKVRAQPQDPDNPRTYTFGGFMLKEEVPSENAAPTDISLSGGSVAENEAVNTVVGQFSSTDPNAGDTFTYTLVSGTGSTDNASFTITGNQLKTNAVFDYETKSSYTIRVRTTDQGGLYFEKAFTITVTNVNEAPVLGSIGNKSTAELAALTFTATATDPDVPANTLTYSLVGAPAGASINASSGAFSWTPTEAQGPGEYTFTVKVCDNGTPSLCDEESITVSVTEVNVAPILGSIGNKSVAELAALTFTATATDADLPANALTFSLVSAPAGATINASSGAFSWTPTEAQGPGSYTFDVCVSDGALNDCETITVTVSEVNVAPVLGAIGNKSVAELAELTFTASATDADVPANTLTFSLVGAPAGASINATSGAFSWTPNEAQGPGSYPFTVKVCDNGTPSLCDEEEITVTVSEVNTAPSAANDSYSTPKNQVLIVTAPGVLGNDSDSDVPANTLTAVLVADIPAGQGTLILASYGAFSYTPPAGFTGLTSFTYKVFDGGLYSGTATVTIEVIESNLAPTNILLTDQTILEKLPAGSVVAYLSAEDPNVGDTFTYSLVSGPGGTDNAAFSISGNQLLSAQVFDYEVDDSYEIRIRVTDQDGLWYEKSFVITILDVNDAPVANNQTVSTPEDTALAIVLTGSDQDGDILTYAVVAHPLHGILTGTAPNLTYTPASNYYGTDSFTFQANDGLLVSNIATVTINVQPVNDAPVLGAIGDKTIAEETELTFTATATDADVPANTLTFSLVGAPAGAAIDPATGAFSWTPTEAQGPGSYPFTVKVCDNGTPSLCDEESITVTVSEVNVAPVLGAIGNKSVAELAELTFTASATDADVPANTLTFSLVGAPTGASINASTGAFSWTPTEAQGPGSYPFTVKVCDNGTPSLCDEESITVTVSEVNVAPVLGTIG